MNIACLLLTILCITTHKSISDAKQPSNSGNKKRRELLYARSNYPKYCSVPSEMNSRSIPPVGFQKPTTSGIIVETQILQASVIIRHGARTPYKRLNCWDGYDEAIGNWDCTLTALMAPFNNKEGEGGDADADDSSGVLLFEKVYDAPPENTLNGTCQLGQLIAQGYDMEQTNGRHLREAYIDNTNSQGQQQQQHHNMQLFPTAEYESLDDKSTYFRGDDEQRTLMSGQVLIKSIFDVQTDTTMKIHTVDYERDILTPSEELCPRLKDLEEDAFSSEEFVAFTTSLESAEILEFLETDLKATKDAIEHQFTDCLMTTYCTDRSMPNGLNDFERDGDGSMFSRTHEFLTKKYTFPMQYNNAAYSKLGMGPLWHEIKGPLEQTKQVSSLDGMKDHEIPRLLLYSGHDWTLMPLLASLEVWDGVWTPYASMLVVESHAVTSGPNPKFPSNHAFRLINNGKVLTDKMDGCDDELCDLDILLNYLEPFATKYHAADCKSTTLTAKQGNGVSVGRSSTFSLLTTTMVVAVLCCAITYITTRYFITGELPFGTSTFSYSKTKMYGKSKYSSFDSGKGIETPLTSET
eukprot:CAMPEP_0195520266 /NCGR_PEP_ID=MMETSP0794_2-20130614/16500_1 /TAXON_ID=515487 /ORGANISM="Stephanopyxis turris, Strain CCMP 815" /LENGTH=578 /DNA_ID=CAMNT_0040649589 /DNA_START=73 /DNA_END=1809 /DNA_ORIENTATION=-